LRVSLSVQIYTQFILWLLAEKGLNPLFTVQQTLQSIDIILLCLSEIVLKALLEVLNNRIPNRRPIWVMRQAGRYLPEYRATREKAGSFLKLCYNPVLACEVTLQPLRRFDFDAAILFSDILVVPQAMGLALDFKEGEGPILETVGSEGDVAKLRSVGSFDEFQKVWETVGLVKAGLAKDKTLIGFCGAPWTVVSYMIEGGSSDRKKALAVALEKPIWYGQLIDKVIEASIVYLLGQIKAGAETVQIFDSWAGDLPSGSLERLVIEPIRKIVDGVRAVYPNLPIIVFARGVGSEHAEVAQGTAGNAIGVEEDCMLSDVLASLQPEIAVQGNLAPGLLLGDVSELRSGVRVVLDGVPMERHIFNLGHGITPQVDPAMVSELVRAVRDFDEGRL
jgi:uroporphyrinogen decarboxylase